MGKREEDGSSDKRSGDAGSGTKDGSEKDKRKGGGSADGFSETGGR